MKRLSGIAAAAMLVFVLLTSQTAAADGNTLTASSAPKTPTLNSISFKNASIEGEFLPYVNEYALTLDDPEVTPTLEDYEINGEAEMFVEYLLDAANHQTGICVTLEYESGSNKYNFIYSNAHVYPESDNNYLSELSCRYTELYPALSRDNESYRLYIPSDMTVLNLYVAAENVGAYCNLPREITIGDKKESKLSATVTASNGETRVYSVQIKRLRMNTAEVVEEMSKPDFKTLVESERFYNNPVFYIILFSIAGGVAAVYFIVALAKRLTVKAADEDEVEFFD